LTYVRLSYTLGRRLGMVVYIIQCNYRMYADTASTTGCIHV